MKGKFLIFFFTILIVVFLVWFFYPSKKSNKKIMSNTEINGLKIDEALLGMNREYVVSKIGNPKYTTLGIKDFDDYQYIIDGQLYGLVIYYSNNQGVYTITDYKFIKKSD